MTGHRLATGPDCQAGKHRACDGRGFDLVADAIIDCVCPCHRRTAEAAAAWRDRQGDVWVLGDDGLMRTPETAPFPREHVEKKWGPLVPLPTEGREETR